MDFQGPILIKLIETGCQFDPKEENQYYDDNAEAPWLVAISSRLVAWAINSLRSYRPPLRRPHSSAGIGEISMK